MPSYKTEARFKDLNGRAGKMVWQQTDHSNAIITGAFGMSAANGIGGGWLEKLTDSTSSPGSTPYFDIRDKVTLELSSGSDNSIKFIWPGPHADIFVGNTPNVDPSGAGMLALQAALNAALADVNGNPVTAFVSGKRNFRKNKSGV